MSTQRYKEHGAIHGAVHGVHGAIQESVISFHGAFDGPIQEVLNRKKEGVSESHHDGVIQGVLHWAMHVCLNRTGMPELPGEESELPHDRVIHGTAHGAIQNSLHPRS